MNEDYDYDFYDDLEDAALTRLRDYDAMSEDETDTESEEAVYSAIDSYAGLPLIH